MSAVGQLSVRLPDALRREVKRKAADEGTSVQAFVERALRTAVAPQPPGPTLSDEARDKLVEFVRTRYADVTRQIGEEDPDLATM
jgi:plasmid stability protein